MANKLTKTGPGRPLFRPTVPQREAVRLMRTDGWSEDRISKRIGVSRPTLRSAFSVELSDGADHERLTALRALKRQVNRGNIAAIKTFLLITGAATAVDEFLQKPETPAKLGKKELARQEAARVHLDSPEWGDDLKPVVPDRLH
jgi:hypothetical protein